MELRHLRYFVAVAEELHFTHAAERLHIGQPPLSHQIQMLEEEIGAQLFERSKRWVRLTDAGKLFLEDARRILALAEQAADTARRVERGEIGELRIGFTSATPFITFFPNLINTYRKHFPGVTVTLREMSTMQQITAIKERSLDLGFVRPPELEIPKSIILTKLRRDPLLLFMPTKHKLAKKNVIDLRKCNGEAFVMYPKNAGTGIYPQFIRLCNEAGFEPRIVQEAREASTIIGLVAAGCGITILPESLKAIRMAGVCSRPLTGTSATTTLMLAHRAGEASPLIDAFFKLAISSSK
jgi:DNA-binding transcriptional LysR family regulator